MGCQQRTRKWETRLRHLDRGSVVLFGSHVSGEFVLDTVLVVDSWDEHSASSYTDLASHIDSTYFDVTFRPWYSSLSDPSLTWRLYRGATIENPVDGMYSFFPCLRAGSSPSGFARPVVTLEGFVTPTLRQGKKAPEVSGPQAVDLWSKVREQVVAQRLLIGLAATIPPERGPVG
jgi:predicted nucleotidyltransferase